MSASIQKLEQRRKAAREKWKMWRARTWQVEAELRAARQMHRGACASERERKALLAHNLRVAAKAWKRGPVRSPINGLLYATPADYAEHLSEHRGRL